ncbi:conserved hypothetical protein [Hahella chejuensis KCTC 2396]|uniref:Helicase C-terminal domain-containing protein n=1 Tax=Hahella chejuensis (strain KCTC 2396) TaxID=349521 RepID=Q2SAF4_HAHCH|nr:helicase-related protein [Hahella chejuensis]ABC32370.1 conserved hypothetical protein [Hahella chejuensis KCTC 2396]
MIQLNDPRSDIVMLLEKELVGPLGGEKEVLTDKPHKRYLMGVLFPKAVEQDEGDEDDSETIDQVDSSIALSSEFKPSSVAISFATNDIAILKLRVSAGRYTQTGNEWEREPLSTNLVFDCQNQQNQTITLFDGAGRLSIRKRELGKGYILTIALSNEVNSDKILNSRDCLYQPKIYCEAVEGCFKEYPSTDRFKFDPEQEEIVLQYSERINWGVGHGCAIEWDQADSSPNWISSTFLPCCEVFGFGTDIDFKKYPEIPEKIFSLQWISSNKTSSVELTDGLKTLINAYRSWISHQNKTKVPKHLERAKERIINRLHDSLTRMYSGIEVLSNNKNAHTAFRLANVTMLRQMVHSSEDFGGVVRGRNSKTFSTPDYMDSKYESKRWRPFQLAFQLLVIESLAYNSVGDIPESRDIVDLLWFPTGGGKTEAYLSIAAWEIIYRRLEEGPKGGGTAVIKRYTLRLLTSQQFQRAGTMICALETIRRENVQLLGNEVISLGLWVGQDSTPNCFSTGDNDRPGAKEKYELMLDEPKPENPFQLHSCPWCGTSIVPHTKSSDAHDYGVNATVQSFSFFCPTDSCEFHERLPIQIVDEALYKAPPTLLIGTVDKFARLPWLQETSVFFGSSPNGRQSFCPPSLIIQDELHLISGPLGTIAGLYEAAIDSIIRSLGGRAKVIAATATIRAANQQVKCLFGRTVQVFPSPGLNDSDSFFSSEDRNTPGRLYIGVMPSGHTGQTALIQTSAALLQAPITTGQHGQCRDTWWTLPIYHNSRRELGKTMTLARDDIPARIKVIAGNHSPRQCDTIEELSANIKGTRIPEVLEKLKIQADKKHAIDILPCTNMISVGVDIGRLGIMLINGQPKTTAEYIQASSRVGRDKTRPPAIVVTLLSPSKPRDRSHYETFSTYHQALYRYVEPTSVTPWALPARQRALHAALVSVIRASENMGSNESAGNFSLKSPEIQRQIELLKTRITEAMKGLEKREIDEVMHYLDELASRWEEKAEQGYVNRYESPSKQFHPLIKAFKAPKRNGLWPTLNSMRNVDTETEIDLWS